MGCLEIEGVIFDKFQGELQFWMEEGSTNLSNRLPWELRFINPWPLCRPWSIVFVNVVVWSLFRLRVSSTFILSLILFVMEISSSGSDWSSLFHFIPSSGSHLVLSFLVEDPLLVLIIVKHFNIDTEGIVEINVMSWSGVKEIGEDSDDLGGLTPMQ